MNRKDLRSAEQDWRATKQPTNRPMPAPKKRGIKLVDVLIVIILIVGGLALYESQKTCEQTASNPSICVD